ncbi:hypothetical protein OIU93_19975 [Paeniglutamicibacter sp. ZC-3]|uniref:hypothetical protein n=1 Tax=Paeniglutamicibacter sp. ZC-3 TaxID=2986919 RepID=UPI0021F7B844|nr:hypothetical protein [Paeniglutamicibacter sp. ZC-3]MCV9996546.1 hypothetical protein [Paeniglutamicibacter sp. ZC-3]
MSSIDSHGMGYNQEHGEPFDPAEAIAQEERDQKAAEKIWAEQKRARTDEEEGR